MAASMIDWRWGLALVCALLSYPAVSLILRRSRWAKRSDGLLRGMLLLLAPVTAPVWAVVIVMLVVARFVDQLGHRLGGDSAPPSASMSVDEALGVTPRRRRTSA